MSKQIFASLKTNVQVLIFGEESEYFKDIAKSFDFDLSGYKKVNFKESLNSNIDDDEVYHIELSEDEEKQFFEDIKLNLDSIDNNLIKKGEYKGVKTIYLVDSGSKIVSLKRIFPTEHIESKKFLTFNDKPGFRKESNKIAISSRTDIYYDISKKIIYFFNFNTLKAVFQEAIKFYRESSKEEAIKFFSGENFEIEPTIFDKVTTKFNRRLGVLIDEEIDFKDDKLMKRYEKYAKKCKVKLEKENGKYILKKQSQLEDFIKVLEQLFYETPITKELREVDSFRTIKGK